MAQGGDGLLGAAAVLVASALWGTNFIVTKGYDMSDGMHFQLLMCTGTLLVGFATLIWAERRPDGLDYDDFPLPDYSVLLSSQGLVGGVVWALGNLLTVPLVQRIGVGLGLSIWGGTSMVTSFAFSRVSIFGLKPDALHPPAAGYFGAILGVVSLAVFSQVESDSDGAAVVPGHEIVSEHLLPEGQGASSVAVGGDEEDEAGEHAEDRSQAQSDKEMRRKRSVEGVAMAVVAGLLYGFQFVPLTIHGHQYPKPEGTGAITYQIRFFFSQFVGIFLTSFVAFAIYAIATKNRPFIVPAPAVLPSIASGMMWAIACMGSMIAVAELGLGIGFPLTSNGAFLVNASWSIFYFREVQGKRNLQLFGVASVLNIASCLCLAAARS